MDSLRRAIARIVCVTTVSLCVAGCGLIPRMGPSGELAITSITHQGVSLSGGFESAVYSFDDSNNLTILLFDGPAENPVQAVTLRVFWQPRAGRTPMDETATNTTVHYVIFAGEDRREVGIYEGAGFVYVKNDPGDDPLRAAVWQATLQLADHTAMFNDLLGKADLKGSFSAKRDDAAVNSYLRALQVRVNEKLGYPRLVRGKG
ncbi:MAG: hypothetical protein GC164_06435 [Phycisphaera sp.]|nr:hypothetical protein [Phycisphaera sp.]